MIRYQLGQVDKKFYALTFQPCYLLNLRYAAKDSKALDEDAWIFWKKKKPAHQNEI